MRWPIACIATALLLPGLASAEEEVSELARFWEENVEVHGYFQSRLAVRSPSLDLGQELVVSQWRNELNLEIEVDVWSDEDVRVGLYSVLRPVYDAVYDVNGGRWGDDARGGGFDGLTLGATAAPRAIAGRDHLGPSPFLSTDGDCVKGEFCLGNGDVGSLFTGELETALIIDDTVFFGAVTAPWRPRGGPQSHVGGNADGETYRDYLESPLRVAAARERLAQALAGTFLGIPIFIDASIQNGTAALASSLSMASQPLSTPLNAYQGALGDRSSLNEQAPFDLNRSEERLEWDCFDNAHPWCFVRELYFELEWGDTWIRLGKQQIVWGKADAFRLQDNIMPIDLGYNSIFPELEDRRIPQLALDVVHSFGDVGPLLDFSVELAWVFDRFRPSQFGQCGEPHAYAIACQTRADAGAHSLFNFALALVEEVPWTFENTEPGLRVEFRLDEPSVSLSFSAFWSHQDLPVARFVNPYSFDNPNPAGLLFLQGLGIGSAIEIFTLSPGSPWTGGFDPYDRSPGGSLMRANELLRDAWGQIFTLPTSAGACGQDASGRPLEGDALRECADRFLALALPWTASEVVLEYPRVLTLGASADYQIPGSDAILRVEIAYDLDRGINDTSRLDGVAESDMLLAVVGFDRPTFIDFLNPERTALLTGQVFIEHIVDYNDHGFGNGMVPPETQIVSTFLMENYWRNDSLVLRSLIAYDWNAQAFAFAPTFRWVIDNHLTFEVGIQMVFGNGDLEHNVRDLCADGTLSCLRDPATWQKGQWQTLNQNLARTAGSPWWSRQSFADRFTEDRDEIWVGLKYQF